MSDDFDRRDWAEDLNQGIRNRDTWFRGLKIVVLLIFLAIARFALLITVFYQFCFCLVRNRPSDLVLPVGRWLARFVEMAILFLTWNSDHAPFPFAPVGEVMEQEPDFPNEDAAFDPDEENCAAGEEQYDNEPPMLEPAEDTAPEDEGPGGEPSDEEPAEDQDSDEPEETEEDRPSQPPRPDA